MHALSVMVFRPPAKRPLSETEREMRQRNRRWKRSARGQARYRYKGRVGRLPPLSG